MNKTATEQRNKSALLVMLAALVAMAILFTLPAYDFNSCVYTKKSAKTFVGDEKYMAALEEVNAVAEDYRAEGLEVSISESVTERTNSKGEVSSLVVFKINRQFSINTWSFLGSGLKSAYLLIGILLASVLSLICAFAGTRASMSAECKFLTRGDQRLRTCSGWFAVIALLLIPVFVMMNTYTFSRLVKLYCDGLMEEGKDGLFALLDDFLFGGAGGENIESLLGDLTYKNTVFYWLAAPCMAVMLISAVKIRFGEIKKTFLRGALYVFVIIVCVITLYPYYVMLVTGFRSRAESNDINFLHMFPTEWLWSNFTDIVDRNVLVYLKNSLLIAGGATLIAMFCGIPAAYSMARRNFKAKKLFLGFVIVSQMFSPVVLLIGIAQLMKTLGLTDSIVGLMLINAAFNQAFAIWLLRGTFVSISPEMEQAALLDGCSTIQSLTKVLLPMAAPGIVTTLIFVFINAWNEYTISTVLISTAANKPITVGLTTFSSLNMIEWQYLFAASLLATIPVVILFICIEKHLVSGLTSGGVKG